MLMGMSSKRKRVENVNSLMGLNYGSGDTSIQEKLAETNKRLYCQYKRDQQKLVAFENHIKSLQLELKSSRIDIDLLALKLREYEPGNDPSLAQVLWSEKKLQTALQRVTNRKAMLLGKNMSSSQGKAKFQFNRSNLPLAASSSKCIYQSGGVIQLPYPGAQISHANYYNYAPIQQRRQRFGVAHILQEMLTYKSDYHTGMRLSMEPNHQPQYSSILNNIQSSQGVIMFGASNTNSSCHNKRSTENSITQKTQTSKTRMKNVMISSSDNNSTSGILRQNGKLNTQSEDQIGKGKRKIDDEVHETDESNPLWHDGPAMSKILDSQDFIF